MTIDSAKNDNEPIPLRRISREWSLKYLYQRDLSGETSESTLEWFWKQQDKDESLGQREKSKLKKQSSATIEGVLANLEEIDEVLKKHARNWTLERMPAIDRNILRIAIYEILYCDDIPAAVSINEALEIVKTYSGQDSASFINGVLDKINKEVNS